MTQRAVPRKRRFSTIIFAAVAVIVFTGGFILNLWRVAGPDWFNRFQRDSEATVIGRLVMSRQSGLVSFGGLLGQGGSPGKGGIEYQFIAYTRNLTFTNYTLYFSQIGGQAMILGIMDAALPIQPSLKLRLFRLLTSFLTALALTSVVLWFDVELGRFTAACVLASAVFAQWLVVFGRNLYMWLWVLFVPMIAVGYFIQRSAWPKGRAYLTLGAVGFLSMLVKCILDGFEYITPTLVMMLLPLVYYAVARRLSLGKFVKATAIATLGASLAIFVSLAILAAQIASLGEGLSGGVRQITTSLLKRTYADPTEFDPIFTPSLETTPAEVVTRYFSGVFFDPGQYATRVLHLGVSTSVPIRYYHLVAALLLASGAMVWRNRRREAGKDTASRAALVATAWASILSPLSWFLIFKSHAAAHYHIDFVVWQMPFTLLVFAVVGLFLRDTAMDLGKNARGSPATVQLPSGNDS